MPGKTRVTILDDHQSIVDGYLYRLNQKPEIKVVATLAYGDELESTLAEHPTDVLLLDFSIPTGPLNNNLYPTLTQIPRLLQLYPDLDILVISMYSERGLIKAVMEAGASGFILKDDSAAIQNLGNIVLSVAQGGIYLSHKVDILYQKSNSFNNEEPTLTHRQLEVLLLCAAFPNDKTDELAKKMTVSNSTVRNLLSGAYLKMGVNTRAAAIDKARKLGLLSADLPTAPRR
jgi:two-component system, NarL family, nitrate/nitrite response regulator NarL